MSNKSVIIIGGGWSVNDGINLGLWDKIKGNDIWSCNSVFKAMPYLPTAQLWVDKEFFKKEVDNLQSLHEKGVKLISKYDIRFGALQNEIQQYHTDRRKEFYYGTEAINKGIIYYGGMGLCGSFALSLAIAMGYNDIYLLGFDFGSPSIGHKYTHWYQNRILELDILSSGAGRPEVYLHKEPEAYGRVREDIKDWEVYTQEKDIKIYNVSLISHLPYFPKIDYSSFFNFIGVQNV